MSVYPLRRLIVPLLLLTGAVVLLKRVELLSDVHREMLLAAPYLTLGMALGLAAYFNRSHLFTAAFGLLVVYNIIQGVLQSPLIEPRPLVAFSLITVMTPATVLFLLVVPSRGLRNRWGMLLASIVPLQIGIGYWVLHGAVLSDVAIFCLEWMPVRPFEGWVLSLAGTAGFLCSMGLASWALVARDTEEAAALLSVLLFAFFALAFFDRALISSVVFGAAGLSLVVSLLRRTHEMAFRDELTGLLGRRALNDRLKGLGGNYIIAMVDVDHFKEFNDTHGHDVGDDVLKVVARHLDQVGGGGTAYRYGGEEFCIVFTGRDMDEAELHLEEVRSNIEHYRMALRNRKERQVPEEVAVERRGRRKKGRGEYVQVTVSIGVARAEKDLTTPQQVIKAADKALYQAKKGGRNRLAWVAGDRGKDAWY